LFLTSEHYSRYIFFVVAVGFAQLDVGVYKNIGSHVLQVSASNFESQNNISLTLEVDYNITGAKLLLASSNVVAFENATVGLFIERASRFNVTVRYGDGMTDELSYNGNFTDGTILFNHTYNADGNYEVSCLIQNRLGSVTSKIIINVFYPARAVYIYFDHTQVSTTGYN